MIDPESQDTGDQDSSDQFPAPQQNAETRPSGKEGGDHGRARRGLLLHWVPSEVIVRYAILATALIAALGFALRR